MDWKKMGSNVLTTTDFCAHFEENQVVNDVSMAVDQNKVTALMGPSGCGKTTLLRCINRMHELIPGAGVKGKVMLHADDLYAMNPIEVRKRIGMVFQRPNPFPSMTIFDNVIAGYKLNGVRLKRPERDKIVEESLRKSALWEEVKDRMYKRGTFLSGGQQQRLCIARALAMKPDIMLMDEPTSALDPKATAHIEELIIELKKSVTILLVTHNMAQAARVSDFTAFMYLGDLVEFGPTEKLFTVPEDKRTEEYLSGKFG
jgi:phosphate transport system ATP-binding protein